MTNVHIMTHTSLSRYRNTKGEHESPYDSVLKVARGGAEGHLPHITLLDLHKIICTAEVKLHEYLGCSKLFHGRWDQWRG